MAKTNLGVSLYYSDAWQAATAYSRNPVSASWGLKDEGSALGQSRCMATLDNRTGAYSPGDARSPLYGLVGRNTPGRVALTPGLSSGALSDTVDAFGRTTVNGWGAADSGETWSLLGSGGTISTANWQVGSGVGTMNVPVDTAYRLSYLGAIAVRDVDVAVTFKAPQATGANLEPANILLRGDSNFDYVLVRVILTTGNAVQIQAFARDETQLANGATVTVDGLTHTGTGQPLRVRALAAGAGIYAKVWIAANAEPDAWDYIATDTTEPPVAGWIGVRSGRATGNTNVTNPQFSYDNWESTTHIPVADGAVSSWQPDRAVKGDAWTDIAITGPMQRVNANKAAFSALLGTLSAADPDAYWPLEDGTATTAPGSGVSAAPPLAISGVVTFAPPTSIVVPGSRGGANLVGGGSLAGSTGLAPGASAGFEMIATVAWETLPTIGGLHAGMLLYTRDDTGQRFGVAIYDDSGSSGNHYFARVGPSGVTVETGLIVEAGVSYSLRVVATDAAPFTDIDLYINDVAYSGSVLATPRVPLTVHVNELWPGFATGSPEYVSHVAVWQSPRSVASDGDAAAGYPGETCAERFVRLAAEHAIAGAVYGSGSHSMGPQFPDTLADLFTEIARTDMGLIYDGRAWNGLEFRTGASLRNQDAAMALTYGVNVAPPIRPVTDDLGLANAVTARGREGTSAKAQRLTGPNNVSEPTDDPEGIGRTEGAVDVNPETTAQLGDIAGWNLHTGTWPGARYRTVVVDLATHPELLAAAIALRPGDRITIDSLDADQVELLVLGGTDDPPSHQHLLTLNCVPAGPYRIGQVETAGFMRIGSATSSLAADFDAGTDTSMSVTVTGSLWSTTAAPFHIRVGGVVLNVTAVAGASSPQTFTVDATPVNGITRTLSADAPAALTRIDVENPIFVGA